MYATIKLIPSLSNSLIYIYNIYFLFFLATTEFETQRKHYSKVSDAYGCLGVLRIPVGKHHFLYNYCYDSILNCAYFSFVADTIE